MRFNIDYRHLDNDEMPSLEEVFSRQEKDLLISSRLAYQSIKAIDQSPERLPLCYKIISDALEQVEVSGSFFSDVFQENNNLAEFSIELARLAKKFNYDVFVTSDSATREYLFTQLAPTMSVMPCWLQNISRVATAHSSVAGILIKSFSIQAMAYSGEAIEEADWINSDISNLFQVFHKLYPTDKCPDDFSYDLPLLLMSIGQFPRNFLPEIIGINLAWHAFGIQGLIENTCLGFFQDRGLSPLSDDQLKQRNKTLSELAFQAAKAFFDEQDSSCQSVAWKRMLSGVDMLAFVWKESLKFVIQMLEKKCETPSEAMLRLIRQKATFALGYHRDKRLGHHKIDDLLDSRKTDPYDALTALANSPYVVEGDAEKSLLCNRLVEIGGPMVGVFSVDELKIIRNWINGLDNPPDALEESVSVSMPSKKQFPQWSRKSYLQEVENEYAARACSLRELFYKLVNIEYFPDILPIAEQFLVAKINNAMRSLTTGERAIPDIEYCFETLQNWVFNKHRQQINAYVPTEGGPNVSREKFIDDTVALAPLLLIDGAWLQGITSGQIVHTSLGRKLFHIFYEEIGMGNAELHHANVYRDLLESMGIDLPEVIDLDFAFSEQFDEESFKVPVLWLAMSCFPRHYMPEILGLNLAVELAGLGSSNLTAHDTLKYFGFPTLFVDLHNGADNVSAGHTAWALDAIKIYMEDLEQREGVHKLKRHWHRIWAGMCLTLPESTDLYWESKSRDSKEKISASELAVFG